MNFSRIKILFALSILCLLMTGCGSKSGSESDDSGTTLSGTVSKIWQEIGISSAYAQDKMGGGGVDIGGKEEVTPQEALVSVSDTTLVGSLVDVNNLIDYATSFDETIENLVSSFDGATSLISMPTLSSADAAKYPYGFGLLIGFDSENLVKSASLFALESDGSYSVKDPQGENVALYRGIFLLNNDDGPEYRELLIANGGKNVKVEPVTPETSFAATQYVAELASTGDRPSALVLKSVISERNTDAKAAGSLTDELKELVGPFMTAKYPSCDSWTTAQWNIVHSSLAGVFYKNADNKQIMIAQKDDLETFLTESEEPTWNAYAEGIAEEDNLASVFEALGLLEAAGIIPAERVGLSSSSK